MQGHFLYINSPTTIGQEMTHYRYRNYINGAKSCTRQAIFVWTSRIIRAASDDLFWH